MKHHFAIFTALLLAPLAAPSSQNSQTGSDNAREPAAVPTKVAAKAEPFDLRDVQLLEGPFKHAQDVNRQVLLQLDMDRMLHPLRREAGLPTTYKGVESYFFPHTGHLLGHFLSASALFYRNTGDEEIKSRADAAVAVLAECQAKLGNGYIGGFPEKSVLELEGLVNDPAAKANVPWYCLHKIYAGLLDMYVQAGNQQALAVLKKAADWIEQNTNQLTDEKMQRMLGCEHGGMNEVLANLYAVTGEQRYLRVAQRFNHHQMIDPFAQGEDPLDNHHANTQIPKFVGIARQYQLTGAPALKTIAEGFWKTVATERSYATGGNSFREGFSPKAHLSEFLCDKTTETCNEYNILKLTRSLFSVEPRAEYADFYERALINQILSTRDPGAGGQLYYQLLQSGHVKGDSGWGMFGGFSCCDGTGLESNSKYADSIYFHCGENDLYVNLFIASTLDWQRKGVKVRQETRFPEQGATRLTFDCRNPVALTLQIRHPRWADKGFQVLVNGTPQKMVSAPGSFAQVERTWKHGDTVEVILPMSLRMEGFKDNPKRAALMYGPLVMAAVTGSGNAFSVIKARDEHFLDTLKPVPDKPLEFAGSAEIFRTSPLETSDKTVTFRPFYSLFKDAYAIYWDILPPAEFQKRAGVFESEIRRHKTLEPRTVDVVLCTINNQQSMRGAFTLQTQLVTNAGWMQRVFKDVSEFSHGVKESAKSRTEVLFGPLFQGITGGVRSLGPGEWFSYQMKVLPEKEQQLEVRIWTPPSTEVEKPRKAQGVLEVLVEGQLAGTNNLSALPVGQFSVVNCPLAPELIKGKDKVEVMLRVPGASTPVHGIYEARILTQ